MKGAGIGENAAQRPAIDAGNLIAELLVAFPELRASYDGEVAEWADDGPPSNYTVVGFVFKPRFKQELDAATLGDFLIRSAEFFERVCDGGDPEALNVIWIKIFEWLLPRPDRLRVLWPIFGKQTRAAIEDAARR